MMMKKKEMKKTRTTDNTPTDVIVEILSRLPVHSLFKFRCVCKSWFNLIGDTTFVYMHLNNTSNHTPNNSLVLIYSTYNTIHHNLQLNSYNIMDDDDDDHTSLRHRPNSLVSAMVPSIPSPFHKIKILGSCNGLLCMGVSISSFVSERLMIWNPCTKEYKNVTAVLTANNGYYNRYGFGYDRSIDDYKLVKTTFHVHDGKPETWVYVYTLGTSSWKTVRSSYKFILCSTDEDNNVNGLFINGHLYYTARKKSRAFDIIVSFDIAKEEYREIDMPVIYKDARSFSLKIGELKGCLCLISIESDVLEFPEVWMMKHNAGDNIRHMMKEEYYTWEKLYTISAQGGWRSLSTKVLRFCKNGEILMVMKDVNNERKEVVLYDPKSDEIRSLRKVFKEENVENYIESLVSLNSGTYMM